MSILPDLILIALFIIAFRAGHKKGFIQAVWKIAALVVTIVLVLALKNPAIDFVYGTKAAGSINSSISENVSIPQGGGVNITESLHLPGFMQAQVDQGIQNAQNAASAVSDAASNSLTKIVITIAVCVGLFIIIRLVLMALHMIITSLSKAPIINGTNRFLGGLLGMVNMLFIVLLALALFTMFAPAGSGLYEIIGKSHLVSYLYNNNILLKLFMKA